MAAARCVTTRTKAPVAVLGAAILFGALLWTGAAAGQSLEEALATAYSSNPELRAARAQLRTVNEGVPQALSNWRPRVTVSGSAGAQRVRTENALGSNTENTEPFEVQGTVTQSLYRGGRTLAETGRAEADVESERAQLHDTEQRVLLDSVTAYMDVWRDQSVLRLNLNNENVLKRQLEASQDRFEVGEITRTDVAQSESRLARATADRIAAEGNLRTSRAVFQQVVGNYPTELVQPPDRSDLPANLEAVLANAQARNPQLISAKFAEEAALKQVDLDFGSLLPELSLVGDASHAENSSTDDDQSDRLRIRALLEIPLYQQGFVSSQVRRSKQVASQRRLDIDTARRAVEQNAISAWEALETARAQIVSFGAEVRATRIALEGVQQENAVGARTILDILDAEQEYLNAQVSLVRAQRDQTVAGYAVLSSMGSLTAADLGLPVELYDPTKDYDAVRNKWFGLGAPGE